MLVTERQSDKNTLVLGLGASGRSCLRYFENSGCQSDIFAYDDIFATDEKILHEFNLSYPSISFISDKSTIPFFDIEECVATPGISDTHTVVKKFLDSNKSVICDIEIFAQQNSLPTVAVTGTNGKSTVVSWLAHVLTAVGKKTILAGNIGKPVLDFINGTEQNLSEFDVVVLELSSFQLERTFSLSGHVALILNISPDHMDRYDSVSAYQAAKESIYTRADVIISNRDEVPFKTPYGTENIGFSIHTAADIEIRKTDKGLFIVADEKQLLAVKDLPLPGEHNLSNALAVLACCKALGVNLAKAAQALTQFSGLPHRTEFVAEIDSVRYVNDSKATNADATAAAVSGQLASIILIVGGDSKQADLTVLKTALAGKLKYTLALGQDAELFVELLGSIAPIEVVKDVQEAVNRAAVVAEAGDTVLLSPACSSLDMFSNYIERGNVFKQAVQELMP